MERNSFSNSLKPHSLEVTKTMREKGQNSRNQNRSHKDHSWSGNSSYGYGDQDYLGGFSWPPRSYTCSFCRREFRSAQALGGHMNVHRRDRVRLRQLLSKDGKHPDPKPNFSSSSLVSHTYSCKFPSLVSSLSSFSSPSMDAFPSEMKSTWDLERTRINSLSPKALDLSNMKGGKSFLEIKDLDAFTEEEDDGCKLLKKAENIVRLDLEMGLLSDSNQDLDLELRLGYS
ncbi:hypothetical protein SLE2022_250510 [Rubroshorea leprosula]